MIMDKNHPLWESFCDDMDYSVFNHRGKNMCEHTTCITRAVLSQYYGVDVDASIEAFHMLGGFCDCEILFNIIYEEE